MHFGFALELSDIDLWNTDLLDTRLGLLNPEISIQISPVSILFVSIKSLRGLQDMSSRRLQDMSSRRLQRNNFSSSKTSSRRLARGLENVFKTSSRRLGRRKIVTLKTCWRRLEDVFKTNKCLLGIIILRGISVLLIFYVFCKGAQKSRHIFLFLHRSALALNHQKTRLIQHRLSHLLKFFLHQSFLYRCYL